MKDVTSIAIEQLWDEPWVKLADGQELRDWGKQEQVAYNQALRQGEKLRFFRMAFDYLASNGVEGDYHEYGCHRARTFRMALTESRRQRLEQMVFYAFDSFQGLPEAGGDAGVQEWAPRALATSEEDFLALVDRHGIRAGGVRTVKGFYAESLTPALQEEILGAGRRVALATIDCDLYESAVPVFSFLGPLLQPGSLLYVDDYFAGYRGSPAQGVSRAFAEFAAESPLAFARFMDVGWWGRVFVAYQDEVAHA